MSAAADRPGELRLDLVDRLLAARDRLLASRRFQQAAASFWPTRFIARRRARDTFDLVAGFVYSQVVLACVRLGVLGLVAERPQDIDAIARRTALDVDAATRLVDAAVALRLLERRSGRRFGLGPLGAPIAGSPGLAAMIEHHALLYADLADPVALLRNGGAGTRLSAYWPYAQADTAGTFADADVDAYSALMSASNALVADAVLDAVPLERFACLLDVGGGDGTFAVAAATRAPRLRVIVFDLPAVAERARRTLARAGVGDRASAVGGSFLADALPTGADLMTLNRVLHDHDDAAAATVLAAAHRALANGGTLVVAEPMARVRGAERVGDAYFGLYLLAMGRGRPRSAERIVALLHDVGFTDARLVPTALPLQAQVIVASKHA